jgi:hypothetical protein
MICLLERQAKNIKNVFSMICYNLFLGMLGNAGFSAQVCSSKIKQEPVLALLSWLGS